MSYRVDIDSLRALAVMLVIIYHANIGIFTGGFVGVDVFFVISGFLMATLVIEKIKIQKFNLISFYLSRIRRIYPALIIFALIAITLAYLSLFYFDTISAQRRGLRAALLGISNFYFFNNTGYFDLASDLNLFLHTWSLSVELQFYFFLPLFFWGLYKIFHVSMEKIVLVLLIGSFVCSVYTLTINESAAFYLLPSRIWEFMFGAYIALKKWTPKTQNLKKVFVLVGISLILFSACAYRSVIFSPYPAQYALIPCFGAALYLLGGKDLTSTPFLKKTLFHPWILFTGLISYSLYLWHWLFFVLYKNFAAISQNTTLGFLICLALTFLVSYLSWRYVEVPFRREFSWRPKKTQIGLLATGILLSILYGNFLRKVEPVVFFPQQKTYLNLGSAEERKTPKENVLLGQKNGEVEFLLLGDSHAGVLVHVFNELAEKYQITGRALTGPKMLMKNTSRIDTIVTHFTDFQEKIEPLIQKENYKTVYLVYRWPVFTQGFLAEEKTFAYSQDGGILVYENGGKILTEEAAVLQGLDDTLAYFQMREVEKVYLVLSVPENKVTIPNYAAILAFNHSEEIINQKLSRSIQEYNQRNEEVFAIFEIIKNKYDFVEILDTRPFLLNEKPNRFIVVKDGKSLYYDDDHLSIHGSRLILPLLEKTFEF